MHSCLNFTGKTWCPSIICFSGHGDAFTVGISFKTKLTNVDVCVEDVIVRRRVWLVVISGNCKFLNLITFLSSIHVITYNAHIARITRGNPDIWLYPINVRTVVRLCFDKGHFTFLKVHFHKSRNSWDKKS